MSLQCCQKNLSIGVGSCPSATWAFIFDQVINGSMSRTLNDCVIELQASIGPGASVFQVQAQFPTTNNTGQTIRITINGSWTATCSSQQVIMTDTGLASFNLFIASSNGVFDNLNVSAASPPPSTQGFGAPWATTTVDIPDGTTVDITVGISGQVFNVPGPAIAGSVVATVNLTMFQALI